MTKSSSFGTIIVCIIVLIFVFAAMAAPECRRRAALPLAASSTPSRCLLTDPDIGEVVDSWPPVWQTRELPAATLCVRVDAAQAAVPLKRHASMSMRLDNNADNDLAAAKMAAAITELSTHDGGADADARLLLAVRSDKAVRLLGGAPVAFDECSGSALTLSFSDELVGESAGTDAAAARVSRVWTAVDLCGNAASMRQQLLLQPVATGSAAAAACALIVDAVPAEPASELFRASAPEADFEHEADLPGAPAARHNKRQATTGAGSTTTSSAGATTGSSTTSFDLSALASVTGSTNNGGSVSDNSDEERATFGIIFGVIGGFLGFVIFALVAAETAYRFKNPSKAVYGAGSDTDAGTNTFNYTVGSDAPVIEGARVLSPTAARHIQPVSSQSHSSPASNSHVTPAPAKKGKSSDEDF